MIKVIRFLLGLCNHQWVVYQEGNVVDTRGQRVGFWTRRKCDKCGKRKYNQHC